MPPVILNGDPRTVPRPPVTTCPDETDDPVAVTAPAFEELEHAIVVYRFTDQGLTNVFTRVVRRQRLRLGTDYAHRCASIGVCTVRQKPSAVTATIGSPRPNISVLTVESWLTVLGG